MLLYKRIFFLTLLKSFRQGMCVYKRILLKKTLDLDYRRTLTLKLKRKFIYKILQLSSKSYLLFHKKKNLGYNLNYKCAVAIKILLAMTAKIKNQI